MLRTLSEENDAYRRKIKFLGILARYFADHNLKTPVVAGGEAVEIYTNWTFTSLDRDIKSSQDGLIDCLEKERAFERLQHNFFNENPLLAVEWRGLYRSRVFRTAPPSHCQFSNPSIVGWFPCRVCSRRTGPGTRVRAIIWVSARTVLVCDIFFKFLFTFLECALILISSVH